MRVHTHTILIFSVDEFDSVASLMKASLCEIAYVTVCVHVCVCLYVCADFLLSEFWQSISLCIFPLIESIPQGVTACLHADTMKVCVCARVCAFSP